ncbi:hypothetical protein [Brevundimonas sp. NIBR11]|uniref:hypothetical protein n=1 Tax=Brevundimonas sp. NIBR11 TaxID=3015999 RepID=UPI0022F0BA66|nr:hypothetical protein [Brevundimonas sp. NIBR11]WGM32173.1 hypothetical protein KKHFBJBL_02424 [Brevundimonas sp. NIBR11]
MIRSLAVSAVVSLAALSLVACQPSGEATKTAGEASLPSGDAMPTTYDWHFTPHGGTGELDFGDGDWAEGVSVFTLSCLPESKTVQMSWGFDEEAVLTSGMATGTFRPGADTPTDHPVLTALKGNGAIDVGLSQADMRLVAKDAGKSEIAAFFDYCDTGKNPIYSAEAAAAEDEANAAEIAAQAAAAAPTQTAPVEAPAADATGSPAT